jgi:hypothetical protein
MPYKSSNSKSSEAGAANQDPADPIRSGAVSIVRSSGRIAGQLSPILYGGSYVPIGVQGPHRAIRRMVSSVPLKAPYLRMTPSP